MKEDNFIKVIFYRLKSIYKERKIIFFGYLSVFVLLIAIFLFYVFVLRSPSSFPVNEIISIPDGQNLTQISKLLKEKKVVRSDFWFKNLVIFFDGDRGVRSGDYVFTKKASSLKVAREVTKRSSDKLSPLKITIQEGLNVFEIADIFSSHFENFDKEEFIKNAKEGYLFPDTYYLPRSTDTLKIISIMEDNFELKTKGILAEYEDSKRSFEEIIKMASILETEARNTKDRKFISGILWNRVEIGMPLQVDVSFKYINGKNSYDLTTDDLKIDSPYNSYIYKGLPPTPISNPSLDAILSAMYPEETDYLYFLHDKEGNVYYGRDFEEHKKNRSLYLD